MEGLDNRLSAKIAEPIRLIETSSVTAENVANMKHFASMFGRELIYVSLIKGT
jgi:hypothetical protein